MDLYDYEIVYLSVRSLTCFELYLLETRQEKGASEAD